MTPFSARALDRGLTGVLVALMRLRDQRLNANTKAGELSGTDPMLPQVFEQIVARAAQALGDPSAGALVHKMLMGRRDRWLARVRNQVDHRLGYREDTGGIVGLLQQPGPLDWDLFTCLNSLRDVEGTVDLVLDTNPTGLRVDA